MSYASRILLSVSWISAVKHNDDVKTPIPDPSPMWAAVSTSSLTSRRGLTNYKYQSDALFPSIAVVPYIMHLEYAGK